MSLQCRLSDAERVDTTVNDVQRLGGRVVGKRSLRGWRYRPTKLLARCRVRPNRSIAKLNFLLDGLFDLGSLGGISHFKDHAIVTAPDLRAASLDVEARIFCRILGRDAVFFSQSSQKFFSLYSHHQVRAALKIQSELDVGGESAFDPRPRKIFQGGPAPRTDYEVETCECDQGDDDSASKEVLFLHCRKCYRLTGRFSFLVDAGDSRPCYLQNRLVGAADKKACVPHSGYHTDDSAGCNHTIANLQSGYRFL